VNITAEEIVKYRETKGLSQEALATILGVSKNTIYNYEKGEKIPDSKIQILYKTINGIDSFEKQNNVTVPYYDVDFTAGFLTLEDNQQTQPTSYITHPFFKDCNYVVRASGQSMAKVIAHGDAIGLTKINNWQEFFPFGEIYAIVTKDNFRMIKVITKGETEDTYTLLSKPTDNKKNDFPPQQIRKDLILSIFKVQASSHLF